MKVFVKGIETQCKEGTRYIELAKSYQKDYSSTIVLALENNRLRELFKPVKDGANISFVTLKDKEGHKAYKRTCHMMFARAVHELFSSSCDASIKIEFSIDSADYITFSGDVKNTAENISAIKAKMLEYIESDIEIRKNQYSVEEAKKQFEAFNMKHRLRLVKYRISQKVNLYDMGGYVDYYYGNMLPSTGYVKKFDLMSYDEGVMMVLPVRQQADKDELYFNEQPKLFNAMKESTKWGEMLDIATISDLNDCIARGEFRDIMLVQEALMEKRIGDIAADIVSKGSRKFIMIAGPSSSGKTSFSHRLSIELRAQGYKPHPIALDNYFVDRERTPLDEDGNKNYECLEALDVELFNKNMTDLLAGKTVELPTYNFISGKTEYKGDYMTLGPDDVLVIEGIHGLNDKLSYSLPAESKYKIYISALTTLNVDEHNRIPTTDVRLLRRMVRDFRTRGASAQKTLDMWSSVRRGEMENIFPFQEEADAMFNSALVYELVALKQYAEPLLFGIGENEPQYTEARRLLKFLNYLLGVSTEGIPNNSLCREFVGGSVFPV